MLHLPAEILQQISTHLSQQDCYQLIFVSHASKNAFIPALYREVVIRDHEQAAIFLKATSYHRYVRHLPMYVYVPDLGNLNRASELFPQLNSVTTHFLSEINRFHLHRPPYHLTSLTCKESISKDSLLHLLSFVPGLKKLDFACFDPDRLEYHVIDSIHNMCPQLEQLTIRCNSWEQHMTSEEQMAIQPANSLKTLEIVSSNEITQQHLWLTYIGNKYPNIVHLTLRCTFGLYERDTVETSSLEFYDWFLSRCPRLVSFKWVRVLPNVALFHQLKKHQRKLCELTLYDTRIITESGLFKPSLMPSLSSLRILLPFNESFSSIIKTIGVACPMLDDLSLEFGTKTYHIDKILEQLLYLKSLEVRSYKLVVTKGRLEQQRRKSIPHPLRKFNLDFSRLSDDVFDYIALRCLELKNLVMGNVRFHVHSYETKICLPQQGLRQIELMYFSRFTFSKRAQIQLLNVQHRSMSSWYFASVDSDNRWENTPFQKLDEEEIQVLTSVISKEPASWPEYDKSGFPISSALENYYIPALLKAGYLKLVCQSVDAVFLNNKRLV